MAAEEQQDGQKTIVAFIVGLLIGGMLVWAFSGPEATAPVTSDDADTEDVMNDADDADAETATSDDTNAVPEVTPAPELQVGNGSVRVNDQAAGMSVELDSAIY
ncbi:hypothetical protein KC906_04155, partial [Candidatus Kaiserbacteria bacterium]|nr:hypothetical protein [Candidatus Kaiserbacteria bacterium]